MIGQRTPERQEMPLAVLTELSYELLHHMRTIRQLRDHKQLILWLYPLSDSLDQLPDKELYRLIDQSVDHTIGLTQMIGKEELLHSLISIELFECTHPQIDRVDLTIKPSLYLDQTTLLSLHHEQQHAPLVQLSVEVI